jgi:hypothetical protein
LNARFERILDLVEDAANHGCFSLEVPLDETFGTAGKSFVLKLDVLLMCGFFVQGYWWDGENQTRVGDLLCARGLRVKFRNPRNAGSVYPSLRVDWFDEEHVTQLVNDLHKQRIKTN